MQAPPKLRHTPSVKLEEKKRENKGKGKQGCQERCGRKRIKRPEFFQPNDAKESNIALPVPRSCG